MPVIVGILQCIQRVLEDTYLLRVRVGVRHFIIFVVLGITYTFLCGYWYLKHVCGYLKMLWSILGLWMARSRSGIYVLP